MSWWDLDAEIKGVLKSVHNIYYACGADDGKVKMF